MLIKSIKWGFRQVGPYANSDTILPLPSRTHCSEPARTPFVAGSELVRVQADPEPFKSPPQSSQMYGSFETQIRHACFCDYLMHTSYKCNAVAAHVVCFAIHLRATFFRLRLCGVGGPWLFQWHIIRNTLWE